MYRLAFGRNDGPGRSTFHIAVMIPQEAMDDMKKQIALLERLSQP